MPAPDRYLRLALAAAAILMITQGVRQSLGLFLAPIDATTGLGVASISFAMAISQLMWGAVQPVAGAIADRWGPGRVLVGGILLLALGNALVPLLPGTTGLIVSLGLLSAIGAGAGSFSVLLGATAHQLPASRQGFASGLINAGGSFGQFVFAPLVQRLISLFGWMGAMWSLAALSLAALPLVKLLGPGAAHTRPATPPGGLKRAVAEAFADRSYPLLHAAFFTCGFHIAFLVTHLPGEVALCGLPPSVASWSLAIIGLSNIFGSLAAGYWVAHHRSKYVLFWMYGSRAVMILIYLAMPRTDLTFYVFAAPRLHLAGHGAAHRAAGRQAVRHPLPRHAVRPDPAQPPDRRLLRRLAGWHRHQPGGDYLWMWYADALLAAIAALLNLPIREARLAPA